MSAPAVVDSVFAQAAPASAAKETAAAVELLDGDEIVELSIKPSLWYIPIVSCKVVLGAGLLAAALLLAASNGWATLHPLVFQLLILVAVLRVGVASLHWASRLYVLTNRRVMRFQGILNVALSECPLKRIGQTKLRLEASQRLLRLGSIQMVPAAAGSTEIHWDHVARPAQVYEKLIRAIRRAQSGD